MLPALAFEQTSSRAENLGRFLQVRDRDVDSWLPQQLHLTSLHRPHETFSRTRQAYEVGGFVRGIVDKFDAAFFEQ